MTLKQFLSTLAEGEAVEVAVKSPGICFAFSTTLLDGKHNIPIDAECLKRRVYRICTIPDNALGRIISVWVW